MFKLIADNYSEEKKDEDFTIKQKKGKEKLKKKSSSHDKCILDYKSKSKNFLEEGQITAANLNSKA